ncbi:proline/betaine transporter [Variibacter gotjawalensis]|uniref:Proline/betaine transporter n=1 Tax=Variibacter gotjawalensis TaxID=1333996 RepID=A0A0S3PRX6_9BRAD|nr:MFS transporter [Variibacter gotjawalensis]NIK48937.1 MFS family permease [Variibacter gotjawalensis]RZS50793.1 Na+/melibiose symporter-like transporter [Variibacter gotjawalensis]BAT58627.1 proline/betaine transporter [Variibacter gotjawalensis]
MAAGTAEKHPRKVIVASCVGSALEWYDFFIYATAAGLVFGKLFFADFGGKGTLIALATFGVGFIARPFGGLFFGYLGDRIGRKPVLLITLMLVGVGTVIIGLLPTYEQIGIWAPILLVAMRLVQGFGAGAEYTGAVIMLAEYAPKDKRGFWCSFAPAGVGLGMMMASGAFWLVSQLPQEQFMSWGWRLPFLASIVIIAFGLYVRFRIDETPVFENIAKQPEQKSKNPIIESVMKQPRNFFVVLGARLAENGFGYLFPVFGLSYAVNTLGFPKDQSLFVLMTSYVIQISCCILFASLSDRIGRRPVYIAGALFGCLIAFPFFWLLESKSFAASIAAFWLAQMAVGMMFGVQASYFSELFGPARRFSGFAFARELGSLLAGGPAPALATAMVSWASGSSWPVAIYAIFLGLCTAYAVWMGPETYRDDISVDNAETQAAQFQVRTQAA